MYKPEKKKLRKDIWLLVSVGIKFRDNRACQKTGEKVYGNNCHPSHIIPQSADKRLALEPKNVKVLSYHSHINWRHKHPTDSGKWYSEKFPKNMKRLEDQHRINKNKGSISLIEYRHYAEQAITLIDSYDWQKSKHITNPKKNTIRLAKNRLLKFIEYMKE